MLPPMASRLLTEFFKNRVDGSDFIASATCRLAIRIPHLPPLAPPPMQGADEMGTLLDTGVPIGPVLPFGPAAAQSPVAQSPTSAPDLEEDGETLVWTDPAGDTPADSPGTGGPAETDAVDETLLGVEMSPEPVLPFVPPTGEDEQAE